MGRATIGVGELEGRALRDREGELGLDEPVVFVAFFPRVSRVDRQAKVLAEIDPPSETRLESIARIEIGIVFHLVDHSPTGAKPDRKGARAIGSSEETVQAGGESRGERHRRLQVRFEADRHRVEVLVRFDLRGGESEVEDLIEPVDLAEPRGGVDARTNDQDTRRVVIFSGGGSESSFELDRGQETEVDISSDADLVGRAEDPTELLLPFDIDAELRGVPFEGLHIDREG